MATASGSDSLGVTMGLVINLGGISGGIVFAGLAIFLKSRQLLIGSLLASVVVFLGFGLVFHQASTAILIGILLGVVTGVNVCGFYATTPMLFPASV
ncbi:hypothetical protein [Arthrobacter sp. ZGTC131]|uniref:hypothetical protein n=1 Tax=Arthrobacter sp. ZGTC131 TaxID=2058898 RepID=UPI000CE3A840|nr:hypothetical protein [Arthrobacter sp. ZGTC131]